ncbi:uncharacterized protein LOC119766712 [Culex quinquefasciatus]|uniref:uncharacterized protein LOC119766712 n=1 Tax=Culex quinquefasciatus TaxID=7176 RepID=UPI0018E29D8E|nr:uncharacterized protein LOC119766712 [Culex quinquefasciatus]
MSKEGDFDVRFLKAIASSGAQAESGVCSLVSRMLQYIAEILRKLGPKPLSETSLQASTSLLPQVAVHSSTPGKMTPTKMFRWPHLEQKRHGFKSARLVVW